MDTQPASTQTLPRFLILGGATVEIFELLNEATPEERARVRIEPGRLTTVKWR